ncbi:MAG: T9SS type A sorting domain-containing protein [Cytophagales bacterium]|nr:T9SS type A sorting domain-containing protein [Cytophagales bacterium]
MTATASGNTVNYTGAAQTVKNVNYANLGLSGSDVKTLQVGTTAITGDLTLSGAVTTTGVIGLTIGGTVDIGPGTTFIAGAFTHNVGGDWINDGTFTGTGSVINFNGAAQSIIGGSATFNDLVLSGSGVKTFGVQVTITNDLFINSVIADLSSITTHTANRLILDAVLQGTTNQTWGSTASGANVQNDTYFLNPSTGRITIAVGGTNFYSSASADWGVNTTWSNVSFGGPTAAGTPGPTDFVFIGGGFSVSVAGTEVCSAITFDPGTSVTNTLTITGSLTVTGAITIPQTITSGQNNLNVGAGNLVAENVAFTTGSPGGTGHRMTISTGTATISSNVTGTGTSSLIIFSGAGLLRLGESFYTSANGTLTTVAGSTVEYNGTDQIIESHTTYRNLTLSGSGNKTLSASTNTTIGGNLVVGDNTSFNIGASTLVVTGTTTVGGGTSGTLSITSTTGTKTFSGLVTIGAGATWTNTTEAVTFQGGITNAGTFTAGTGIQTFNANSQALTGTFTIPSVTVTGGAVVLTNNNSLTVNTALSGTGRITQGAGATLNIGGTSGITNMTATASGNTVNYSGAAQTVNNVNYENLGLSGSGAKTLQVGTTAIIGDLTLGGTATTSGVIGLTIGGSLDIGSGTTFTAGAFTHNLGGNFINNGSFAGGSGTIGFVGAAPQTISGTTVTNFNNISISNTTGVLVESNQNLVGVLSLAASSVFDADGGSNTAVFTLLSSGDSPTQDASIATLPAGASVIGDVTVQRYMEIEGASGGRIYRYVSSPVQSAPVSQIQAEIPVTGSFTGTSVCAACGSTQSMFLYNESVITDTNGSGGNNFDDGYEDFPNASNSEILTTGRGYALFVRGNIDPVLSSGSARWDVRGPIISGTIDYTPFTTFTSSGNVANDGWNLVGNPYPSTIDWDAATGWTRTNINNAIYMRDNGLLSPVYASYVGGVGTNGGSRYIATGQAFFVKSNGGAINFQSDENVKVGGTQTTFIREGGVSDLIRITLKRDGNKDETVIRFNANASNEFDPDLDAVKLPNSIFNLSTVSGNNRYAINSVPENSCRTTIQLNIANASVGNYELNFSDLSTFSNTPVVSLLDGFTGQAIAITDNMKYNFSITSDVNSSGNRFSIIVEQPAINLLIHAQGADKICIDSPYNIALATSETGVKYFASIDGNTVSEPATGNGGELILNVSSDMLALGENTLTLYAQRNGCTALPLSSVVNVTVDRIYEVLSVTDGLSCQSGQSTLRADGAPANGKYRWYQSVNSSELISETSNGEFVTPVLDKTKSYYVSVVNTAGCEGNRQEVKAVVEQFENAEITETSYGVLTSNHSSGNRWYYNNELISGATGQSITVAESGLYRVEVEIGTCKTIDEFEFVVTGVEESKIQARAYPNPVVDKLIVQIAGLGVSSIEIISNSGIPVGRIQVKKNTNDVEIDFADKPTGLYLVKLNSDRSAVSTFKIIKK